MAEKPILFNTDMVRAILDGKKTVTRRILKPKYKDDECGFQIVTSVDGDFIRVEKTDANECGLFQDGTERPIYPPYQVGDVLYVRETWGITNPLGDILKGEATAEYVYKAGYSKGKRIPITKDDEKNLGKWRPSIHMPKDASRIFLKVTNIGVEQLQDMTEKDAMREGIREYTKDDKLFKYAVNENQYTWQNMPRNPIEPFKKLWDSKFDWYKYGFDANPWVWVIEFEKIDKENV